MKILALPPESSVLVQPPLRHYSANDKPKINVDGELSVDSANNPRNRDLLAVATTSGWTAYDISDIGG